MGAERKIVQNAVFVGDVTHDNQILKAQILLSRDLVLIARAPCSERGGTQKHAKERKRALPHKSCKQPGLKQPVPNFEMMLAWEICQKQEKSESGQEREQSVSQPMPFCTGCTARMHRCTLGLHWCKHSQRTFAQGPDTPFAPSPDHFSDFPCFDRFPRQAASQHQIS